MQIQNERQVRIQAQQFEDYKDANNTKKARRTKNESASKNRNKQGDAQDESQSRNSLSLSSRDLFRTNEGVAAGGARVAIANQPNNESPDAVA